MRFPAHVCRLHKQHIAQQMKHCCNSIARPRACQKLSKYEKRGAEDQATAERRSELKKQPLLQYKNSIYFSFTSLGVSRNTRKASSPPTTQPRTFTTVYRCYPGTSITSSRKWNFARSGNRSQNQETPQSKARHLSRSAHPSNTTHGTRARHREASPPPTIRLPAARLSTNAPPMSLPPDLKILFFTTPALFALRDGSPKQNGMHACPASCLYLFLSRGRLLPGVRRGGSFHTVFDTTSPLFPPSYPCVGLTLVHLGIRRTCFTSRREPQK